PPRRRRSGRRAHRAAARSEAGSWVAFPPARRAYHGASRGVKPATTRKSIDKGSGFPIVCRLVTIRGDVAMPSTTRSPSLPGVGAAAASTLVAIEPASSSRAAGRRREDRLVGPSDATRRLIAQAAAAARTELVAWIVGPAGADHALVARAVHEW